MLSGFMGEQYQPNALETEWPFLGSANDSYYLAGNELNMQYMEGVDLGGIHYAPAPSPRWTHRQQAPKNYVEFLAENVVSDVQVDASAEASGFGLVDGYADMFAKEQIRYLSPYYEGVPLNYLIGSEHEVDALTWEPRGIVRHTSDPLSGASAAGSSYPSKISRKSKAALSDQRRKMRIAESIEALGGLLHGSKQGGRAAQMDDIIDHIKYLQFQIKDLSRSRLGGEPNSVPFVFLEGCGHCILDAQLTEPLEETMGKLLEVNPSMATQLLEDKGLFMMRMALAEGLYHHE